MVQHVRQLPVGVGTHDKRDVLLFLHQLGFEPFGHATQNANLHPSTLALQRSEFAQTLADALFGVVADGTGVDENKISLVDIAYQGVAGFGQNGTDNFTVGQIHLATVCFYEDVVFQCAE